MKGRGFPHAVGGRGTEQEILLNGSRRRALGMGV